jgi:hypothetical protein
MSHARLTDSMRTARLTMAPRDTACFLVVLVLSNCFLEEHRPWLKAAEPGTARALICGRAIELQPPGASFRIPQAWLEWDAKFHNNIHRTPADLKKVRVGDGEWDKEYAEIVNSVLPFDSCLVHAGGEAWGKNAVSFADVQMRAYIVELPPRQIAARMANKGRCVAMRYSKKVALTRSEFDKWLRVTLSYDLWYTDYGGTANVDVFARAFGNQTAVLVFMYSDAVPARRSEVETIVESFRWNP